MSNLHPMQAPNQGNPNMKLNLNPTRVLISSTNPPQSQTLAKAMPRLNPIYLQNRQSRREAMPQDHQEATPRLSTRKLPRRVM